jgi:dihydroorotase-like cyclic amidohydrolase
MSQTIILPGLIDPHVHLRDPGQTHKEDFYTGAVAAVAGGYTAIFDMPNNAQPITTHQRLEEKLEAARAKIVCDLGIYFGTLGDNFDEFPKVTDQVAGLKIYLNVTTGNFVIDQAKLIEIYRAWPSSKPILLHAEDDVLHLMLDAVRETNQVTHICHVSSEAELKFVLQAKEEGLPVSCGVCPHHLFLINEDVARLGSHAIMKPSLKSQADQDFLWQHLDAIDIIESDHAPHTIEEKAGSPAPFGVPGLETTLSLMLTAERDGRITRRQLLDRLHHNPARIFNVPTDDTTKVTVIMDEYVIKNEDLKTKAGWSPFDGMTVVGRVQQVDLRGHTVYKDGKVVAQPGSGQILS